MNIGIVGSGNVGGALGTRWAQAGHRVVFGSRNPASDAMRELVAKAGPNARAASLMEAVAAAEAVLLATPWPATRAAIEGSGDLAGKVLIDATNPLLPDLTGVECGATTSGGEWVAGWALGAKVVKAFNSVGANIMANPVFGPDRPVMFYCGDDAGAKLAVKRGRSARREPWNPSPCCGFHWPTHRDSAARSPSNCCGGSRANACYRNEMLRRGWRTGRHDAGLPVGERRRAGHRDREA
jgi:hypothetical protein